SSQWTRKKNSGTIHAPADLTPPVTFDLQPMTRSRHALGFAIVTLLAGVGVCAGVAGQSSSDRRVRALVISSGAFHDYLYQSKVFAQAVGKAVPVDWTIVVQGSE